MMTKKKTSKQGGCITTTNKQHTFPTDRSPPVWQLASSQAWEASKEIQNDTKKQRGMRTKKQSAHFSH